MDNLRLRLMHREAIGRLSDAHLLIEADPLGDRRFDSGQLLELLGLELLLKFLFEVENGASSKKLSHKYADLFDALSQSTRARIVSLCEQRIGPSDFSSRGGEILKEWSENFVLQRYPYEKQKGLTEAQYKAKAERWLAKGAPLKGADFRLYPNEFTGVIYALQVLANEHAERLFGPGFVHDVFQ